MNTYSVQIGTYAHNHFHEPG